MDDTGVRLMRATKAYIASLGTTGVVLAASILMLAVVSAVVGFDRWPGSQSSAPARPLLLTERAAPIRVSAKATAPSATASRATGGVTTPHVQPGTRAPAAAPAKPAPVDPAAVTNTVQSVQDTATPIVGAVSNPRSTAGQLADGAQAVTNAAAGTLSTVSPDVGGAVEAAGTAAADVVRQAPLPRAP